MNSQAHDVLIIGGGVIGLSLAWELAQRGTSVCLVDRRELGQEASWAGAGMLPPGAAQSHWHLATPLEQLTGLSSELHSSWSQELLDVTGINNQYRRCGALHLAATVDELKLVNEQIDRWQTLGIACQEVTEAEIASFEPALAISSERIEAGYFVPAESQIRNPRHLQALIAACHQAGVDLRPHTAVKELRWNADRVTTAVTTTGALSAEHFCLTAGCWSSELAQSVGLDLPVNPIRGQIVLLQGPPGLLSHHVHVGLRYLTPRQDGRILIGSTMEDVGFDRRTTTEGTSQLLSFAAGLSPALGELPVETSWAGLRPGTPDDEPILGRLPPFENAWLATGHLRAGLQLSPATAVVMSALVRGQKPPIDVSTLGVERFASSAAVIGVPPGVTGD